MHISSKSCNLNNSLLKLSYSILSFNGQVIKPKLARPGRVPVTTCAWDREGKCIAGGIGDGSIQVFLLVHFLLTLIGGISSTLMLLLS